MDVLLGFIVMAAVLGAVWFLFMRPGATLGKAAGTAPQPLAAAQTPAGGAPLTPNLSALKPGDAISFWDGTDAIVRGSLDCREDLGGRVTEWRWIFLAGDCVLELLPSGQTLYESSTVSYQGDEFYEAVVAALKRFEGNVREGIAHDPVELGVDEGTFRVRSTGSFSATRVGELPEHAEVWSEVSPNQGDNIFFKLVGGEKDVALGIWTTHILILRGRSFDRSEITGVYAT